MGFQKQAIVVLFFVVIIISAIIIAVATGSNTNSDFDIKAPLNEKLLKHSKAVVVTRPGWRKSYTLVAAKVTTRAVLFGLATDNGAGVYLKDGCALYYGFAPKSKVH